MTQLQHIAASLQRRLPVTRHQRNFSTVTCYLLICILAGSCLGVQACGDDPLINIQHIAQSKGVSTEVLLRYIQNQTPDRYRELIQRYSRYQQCMGRIDTGYFKRDASDDERDMPNSRNEDKTAFERIKSKLYDSIRNRARDSRKLAGSGNVEKLEQERECAEVKGNEFVNGGDA